MHGSQDELKSILQEKLYDYESKVPGALTDSIFTKLKSARRFGRWKSNAKYAATTIVFLGALWFVNKEIPYAKSEKAEILQSDRYTSELGINLDRVANTEMKDNEATLPVEKARHELNDSNEIQPVSQGVTNSQSLSDGDSQTQIVEKENSIAKDEPAEASASREEKAKPESLSRFRIGVTVMPWLAFSHGVPNSNDGIILSDFKSSGSFGDRAGVKIGLSVDYAIRSNNFIYGELSYFDFRTAFSYKADETLPGLDINNMLNQKYFGVGAAVGIRMPLRIANISNQYLSVGAEAQWVSGGTFTKSAWMLQTSYVKEFALGPGMIRIQPTINYSLTKYQYPGLSVHPFMVGLGIGYVLPVN